MTIPHTMKEMEDRAYLDRVCDGTERQEREDFWHYQIASLEFGKASDEWPGGFRSGEKVHGGQFGDGIVTSHAYCMGTCPSQKGKLVEGTGIHPGEVPVLYPEHGCWWVAPGALWRRGEDDHSGSRA